MLLARRRYKNMYKYRVRWRGYAPEFDEWLLEKDVEQSLIVQFEKSLQKKTPAIKKRSKVVKRRPYIETLKADELEVQEQRRKDAADMIKNEIALDVCAAMSSGRPVAKAVIHTRAGVDASTFRGLRGYAISMVTQQMMPNGGKPSQAARLHS